MDSIPSKVDPFEAARKHSSALWAAALNHPVVTAFSVALLVRVTIAVFLTRYFSGTLVLDDTTYHGMITSMASGETSHWGAFTRTLYWSTATLTAPATVLYRIFGSEMLVGQLYVGLMGSVAVGAATRLALELLRARWALVMGLLLALLPSQAFWSSVLMKDAPVWMVLTGLALVVAIAGRSTGRGLVLTGVAAAALLTMLSYLRLHTLVVASVALVVASIAGTNKQRLQRVAGAAVIAITVPWVFGGIGPAGIELVTNAGSLEDRRFRNAQGANTAVVDVTSETDIDSETGLAPPRKLEQIEREQEQIERKKQELETQAVALRQTLEDVQTTQPGAAAAARRARLRLERIEERIALLEARVNRLASRSREGRQPPSVDEGGLDPDLVHLPRGLSVMLLEPFPVPFTGSISLRLARAESVIWYPLLLLAAIGLVRSWRNLRVLVFPLVAGAAIVVMYALTEGNIGTAHRHRGEFVWVVVLLAGAGLAHLLEGRSKESPAASVVSSSNR